MNLDRIVARLAEGMSYVDTHDDIIRVNYRTKQPYLPGLPSMGEVEVVDKVADWWKSAYPGDFNPPGAVASRHSFNPDNPKEACDLVFTTEAPTTREWEWAIEVKRFQFVGDNGGKNDHHVQKMLSPYLKDRSLIHDIHRLNHWQVGQRQAVIGYMFAYDFKSCEEAEQRHPDETMRIKNVRVACRSNDAVSGRMHPLPLIEVANNVFHDERLVYDVVVKERRGLWRHPCGGTVVVFGWELVPQQQSDGEDVSRLPLER